MTEPGCTCTWPIEGSSEDIQGFRHIRIQQNGKNSSGQHTLFNLSGFEVYGKIVSVCENMGKIAAKETETKLRKDRRLVRSQLKHSLKALVFYAVSIGVGTIEMAVFHAKEFSPAKFIMVG